MNGRHYAQLAADAAGRLLTATGPAIERLSWDQARLARHRQEALRETLLFAATRSHWHADRLADLDLDAVDPTDLSVLPVMTKGDLMAAWDDIVTDPRLSLGAARAHLEQLDYGPALLLDEYHVLTTGGSSGEPGVFCWSLDELMSWMASAGRWLAASGILPRRRAVVAARSLRHATAAIGALLSAMFEQPDVVVPVDQPLGDIVARLNELQPDSLLTHSSMLPMLVDAARTGRLQLDLVEISVGSDVLDPAVAELAAQVFGAPVLEGYPTTDAGHVAQQAPGETGLYLNEDFLVVEVVDEHDRPVPPGREGDHVLVTSLHQRTLPLIRYRIDDRVRLAAQTGRYGSYRKLAAVEGRSDDVFVYGGAGVHPHVFRAVLARYVEIRDYQVIQTPDGADVTLSAAGPVDRSALSAELAAALGRAGVVEPQVAVSVTDRLPRTAVGKRLRFVPLARHSSVPPART